jgi:CHASE2 domain-containing sensor protein
MLKRVLLILAASCCGMVATAQTPAPVQPQTQVQQSIYKWTDAEGKLQYSELPPPAGITYEVVRKSAKATPGEAALSSQQAKEREELARQEAERKAQAEKTQQAAQDQRAKNCEIAKKNVEVLQGDSQIVKTNAEGKKVVVDAEQRAAELKKAQKDADYYCNP